MRTRRGELEQRVRHLADKLVHSNLLDPARREFALAVESASQLPKDRPGCTAQVACSPPAAIAVHLIFWVEAVHANQAVCEAQCH